MMCSQLPGRWCSSVWRQQGCSCLHPSPDLVFLVTLRILLWAKQGMPPMYEAENMIVGLKVVTGQPKYNEYLLLL